MYIMHSWASMSENTRQQALKTRENMHHKQYGTNAPPSPLQNC